MYYGFYIYPVNWSMYIKIIRVGCQAQIWRQLWLVFDYHLARGCGFLSGHQGHYFQGGFDLLEGGRRIICPLVGKGVGARGAIHTAVFCRCLRRVFRFLDITRCQRSMVGA